MIPWRIKNFVSDHFPLFYHKLVNIGVGVNDDRYWDAIYEKEWDSPKRAWPTKNRLIAALTDPGDHILDIACGTGSILRYLKDQGYENLHGTEISNLCIERLRALGIEMFSTVLPRIACGDHLYDAVIASQILEHVIERRRFLTEIRRVLKPGGLAFIFVPDNCLGPIDEPSHVVKFTKKSLSREIGQVFDRFEVVSMKDENFSMPILFATIRA